MEQEIYVNDEEELDIKELMLSIKKHLVLVITLPIIFSSMAAAISFFVLKPVYQASVSIIISKDAGSVLTQSDVTMYQSLTKTYIEIAKSNGVAEKAIRNGHLKTSLEVLQSSLTVSSQEGTQVLKISVDSNDPADSVKKAEVLSKVFLIEARRLLPSGSINIMDDAKVPQSPIKPKKMINSLIGFVIGFVIAIVLAILIENMNDTVKSEDDIEKNFDLPILGVIP